MKIYEKENFKDLPKFFWDYWLDKVKNEIIKTSYPIFVIRVGIGKRNEESFIYEALWKIKEEKNDATFYDHFHHENEYVGIAVNTIYDYINLTIEEIK